VSSRTTETIIEQEVKLLLPDEGAWLAFRQALGDGPSSSHRQVNTYFDTRDERLARERSTMVRVREQDRSITMTVKDRVVRDLATASLTVRERSVALTPSDWQRVHRGQCALTALELSLCVDVLAEIGEPLFPIGSMVNTRLTYPLRNNYIAEVDATELPGGRVEYEVEVECRQPGHTLAEAREIVTEALDSAGILGVTPSLPKYQRFLDARIACDTLADSADLSS
jgi:uncharacterized protein YjbK